MSEQLAPSFLGQPVADLPAPGEAAKADAPPKRGPGRPKGSGKAGRDKAPRTAPEAPSSAARGPGRPSAIDKLAENLGAQFAALASIVMMFQPTAGRIMLEDADAHGKALAKLAEQNPRVRKLLEGGLTGSAWVGVAVAFGTTAVKVQLAVKAEAAMADLSGFDPSKIDLSNLGTMFGGQ